MIRRTRRSGALVAVGLVAALLEGRLLALQPPDHQDPVQSKKFRREGLWIPDSSLPADQVSGDRGATLREGLERIAVQSRFARLDPRGGTYTAVFEQTSLLPGPGVGNHLTWSALGRKAPAGDEELKLAAWTAVKDYLSARSNVLRIDVAELSSTPTLTLHRSPQLIQIYAPRVVNGIPVRDSSFSADVHSGNLILFGAEKWGPVTTSAKPTLSEAAARKVVIEHAAPEAVERWQERAELNYVPMDRPFDLARGEIGSGYDYRLAWVLRPRFSSSMGSWEALVDAHSGELLAFEDKNHYASNREATGGVFPKSNDGVAPDGIEKANWPMPFADITNAGRLFYTDAGGALDLCVDGTIASKLNGLYVRMNDHCGAINGTAPDGASINFGTSTGTNCKTPDLGGAGNTHASRTGYFELNRIIEGARSRLPNNVWLKSQVTANMNINQTCNAFWDGATVNFYRSGGSCSNTGELAGVFDHEWGHGLDDNDGVPNVSNPGEGIADIYAALRLNDSCLGRNFLNFNCTGYGDACTSCTGVRDIDWNKHTSHAPHTVSFAVNTCAADGTGGVCNGEIHCEGVVYAEAVWDLFNRDLMAPPFNLNRNTALEITTRLTYVGAGGVTNWYTCNQGSGGCAATTGYQRFLVADDDNGNLADGTPHMGAIFSAFNRHGIACTTPANKTAGCSGTPTTAPVVTASPRDGGAKLSWANVAGATKYVVYRTDGVFGCNYGKIRAGEVLAPTTEFFDKGLKNGFSYYYTVAAIRNSDTCTSPLSACTNVTPAAGPDLGLDTTGATVSITSGDGDNFLDNCETARVNFNVQNIGTGTSTNVRITKVVPSVAGVTVTTPLPQPITGSLNSCTSAAASFNIAASGLSYNQTLGFDVTVTSDQIAPESRTFKLKVPFTESDPQAFATRTFGFEANADNWTVVQGTFNRTTGGINGAPGSTTGYMASSSNLPLQCDQVRSPVLFLAANSTLSMQTHRNIEPFSSGFWYDRANVGIYDLAADKRTVVSPSGGRTYNASGDFGECITAGQAGWGGVAASWSVSNWTAAALQSATFANRAVQLDIAYGTDESVEGTGFRFDVVTVTNGTLLVPDAQSNTCSFPPTATPTLSGPTFTPVATATPTVTPTAAPAGAPRFPSLAAHGFEGLDQTWHEGLGGNPASYRIYVSNGIEPFSSVVDVPGDHTTYNHAKMGQGSYYFRVTGVNSRGESPPSKQVHAILDGLSPGGAQSRTFANEMAQDLRIRLWAFESQSPARAVVPGFGIGVPEVRSVPESGSSAARLGGVPFPLLASGSDRSPLAGAEVPEPWRQRGRRIGGKPRGSARSASPATSAALGKAGISREEESVYNFDPAIEGDELVYVTGFTGGDRIATKIVPRSDAYPLEVRSGFLYLYNELDPESTEFTGLMTLWADDNGGLPGTQLAVEPLGPGDVFLDPVLGWYYVTKVFAEPRPRIESGSFFISVEWSDLDFGQNPVQENAMAGHTSTGRNFRYSTILTEWQNWDDVLGFLATDWLEGVSIEPNLPGTGPTPTPAQATKTPTGTRTPTSTETPRPVTPGACNVVVEVHHPGGALAGRLAAGFDETDELHLKAAQQGEFEYEIHTAGNCNGDVNYVVTSGPDSVLGGPTSPVPPGVAVLSVLLLLSLGRRRRRSARPRSP